jgi:hypothetical protein
VCHCRTYPDQKTEIGTWQCYTCAHEINQHIEVISDFPSNSDASEPDIPSYGRGIKIGHINIRDLMSRSKLHDVQSLINSHRYDVFAISETWLWRNITNEEVTMSGYNMFRADRCNIKSYNNRGGGVLVYVKEGYEVKQIESLFSYPEKVQSIQL